ncbi:MAG: glycerol-3-phosphate acyltransferase [Chloroherpetonaceae bacterium]|nr:glycerol-3-phosphate acyltransferase [bacterium]
MNLTQIFVFLISYIIGSIPFAYIFTKKYKNLDLTKEGSRSLGAMNAYESSHNIWIGIMVLIADLGKGALTTAIAINFEQSIAITFWSSIGAVLGHNFSIFMKFKGGRGLAVSTGALMLINPIGVIIWLILYFIARYVLTSNVHLDNLFACVLTPIILLFTPDFILWDLSIYSFYDIREYRILVAILSGLIIIKHIEPIYALIKQGRLSEDSVRQKSNK